LPRLTRPRLDSPFVTTSPLPGSTVARLDDSKSAPPSPADASRRFEEDAVVEADVLEVGSGTLTVGVGTVGVGTVGVGTDGTVGTVTGTLGFGTGVAGAFSFSGTSHFAFHAARAELSFWENPLGAEKPGADAPFEASEHCAVAL